MGLFRHHHHHTATVEAEAVQDTFETNFLRYLRTFDGSKRAFSEVEALFNQLYDDDFYESKNDTLITKDQVKQSHTRLFELGSKVTLTHFKHKGVDQIDIKYRLVNAESDLSSINALLQKTGRSFVLRILIKQSMSMKSVERRYAWRNVLGGKSAEKSV